MFGIPDSPPGNTPNSKSSSASAATFNADPIPAHPVMGIGAVRPTHQMAVVSLVLGVLAYFVCPVVLAIAAIFTGRRAKREIAAAPAAFTGEVFATVGIVLGAIQVVAVAAGLVLMLGIGVITFFGDNIRSSFGGSAEALAGDRSPAALSRDDSPSHAENGLKLLIVESPGSAIYEFAVMNYGQESSRNLVITVNGRYRTSTIVELPPNEAVRVSAKSLIGRDGKMAPAQLRIRDVVVKTEDTKVELLRNGSLLGTKDRPPAKPRGKVGLTNFGTTTY